MRLIFRSPLTFIFLLWAAWVLGCASSNVPDRPSSSPTPPATSTTQRGTAAAGGNFSPTVVCSLPKETFTGTTYDTVGGGSWRRLGDSDGELDYGCEGGKDYLKLVDESAVEVTAEYGAIGGPQIVHYVSAEYMALQYFGQTPVEKQLRQKYADFCDKLSEKFYGQKLPATFRKRLLDESTYSQSGTTNEYAEKVGKGYVKLSSNKNQTKMIMLDVHFFSSEEEYKNYKDA